MMNRSIQSKRSNTVLSVTAALTCFSWAFLSAAATLPRDDHRVRAIALITNSAAGQNGEKPRPATKTSARISAEDDAFLDDISRRSFQFFWDASDPNTGVTREHMYWDGSPYPAERREVDSTGARLNRED